MRRTSRLIVLFASLAAMTVVSTSAAFAQRWIGLTPEWQPRVGDRCNRSSGYVRLAGQGTPGRQRVEIPAGATSLEGIPTVRIDSDEGTTTRRVLDPSEAAKALLKIKVMDGQFYWTNRSNRPLRLYSSGEFTYLSSVPGQYIRLTRVNDRISYIEHVDVSSGSVTWFGELKIVVGK